MAILHDASSTGTGTGATITVSHICTGTDLALMVYVTLITGAGATVTGVTYNGVSMSQIKTTSSAAGAQVVYMFGLLNPATGTHNIVVSTSGAIVQGDVIGESYTGVIQSGLPDSSNSGTGIVSSTSLTVATTTVSDNCVLVGMAEAGGGNNPAASTNTFVRTTDSNGTMASLENSGPLNPESPPGSFSLRVTYSANFAAMLVASLAPSLAINSSKLTLLGVS